MNARPSRFTPRGDLTRRSRRVFAGTAGLTALLALGALGGCGSAASTATDPATGPGAPSPSSTPVPTTAGSVSSSPSAAESVSAPATDVQSASGSPVTSSPTASGQVMVPVYYVLRTPKGLRLAQELRAVPAANPVAGAAHALEQAPHDPDYASYYHPGDLGDARFDGTAFTAVLTNPALAKAGALTKSQATIAVQQLVYTLAAAQGATTAPTRVVADGNTSTLFGIATSPGVKPADQPRVLADVNVLSPAEGSAQSGALVARGLANSPEANVLWRITDGHDHVVKHGGATATGWMDKLYPWRTRIDISALPAGTYTFTASTDEQADPGEGPGPSIDTKTFTIS